MAILALVTHRHRRSWGAWFVSGLTRPCYCVLKLLHFQRLLDLTRKVPLVLNEPLLNVLLQFFSELTADREIVRKDRDCPVLGKVGGQDIIDFLRSLDHQG